MDLNIKGLDPVVVERLKQQAAAAGVSLQQYLRDRLAVIASRLSPGEIVGPKPPMTRDEFAALRERLRRHDAA